MAAHEATITAILSIVFTILIIHCDFPTLRITNPCTQAAVRCSILETITPPLGDG